MKVKVKACKKYSICSCGDSKSLTLCDNAHRALNLSKNTNYKSIKITPDKDVTIQVASSNWNLDQDSK